MKFLIFVFQNLQRLRRRYGRPRGSIADDLYPDAEWKNEKPGEFDP